MLYGRPIDRMDDEMGADQMELIYTGNEIKEMDRQETKGGTEIL